MRVSHTVLMVRYKARCYEHNLRVLNEYKLKLLDEQLTYLLAKFAT